MIVLFDAGVNQPLRLTNIQNRLIQQDILQVLTPMLDPNFSELSFGFRQKHSAQGAVKPVQIHIQTGYRHCVEMDLSKFFDRVQHDLLLSRVARVTHDKRLLRLLGRYLRAGVLVGNQQKSRVCKADGMELLVFRIEGYSGQI